MIEIINLTKKYGTFTAVEGLNLEINKGELFGIVGPNGAGKTTLIRVMCGSLKPTGGTIKVGGYDVTKNPIEAKSILGYLPEEPNLYERLTPGELLTFFAKLYGVENPDKRIKSLLEMVGLLERRNSKISTFSKGMKQRLMIVRSIIHDPEILVLDEPTFGLDPGTAMSVRNFIQEQKRKKTILICTHNMQEAEMLCDRIGILNNAKLVANGKPAELKNAVKENGVKDPTLYDVFVHFVGGG